MKIFFDIGHPGHVHYFRRTIKYFTNRGDKVIVAARNRNVVKELLEYYNIDYFDRGEGSNSILGKLLYMIKTDIKYLRKFRKNKPDIFISFSSPYAAQTAFLLHRPHIALNDTEHTDKFHKIFTYPFSKYIITPASYYHNLGSKQIKFKGIIEDIYLNNRVFTPDKSVYNLLKINENEPYVILRFVSWNAHHDVGQSGLDLNTKRELVTKLSKKFKVFISAESALSEEFKSFEIKIPAHKMHDVLAYSSLFVGESGTMASESAYLGVPTVYINSLPLMCYLKLEQQYGVLKHFKSSNDVIEYVDALIHNLNSMEYKSRANEMKSSFINASIFLTWFIENYPESARIMKENPEYQNRFK